jgi:LmbE family N-acetylglucosaminyl deacetylase
MPEAGARNRYYGSFRTMSYGRHPDDDLSAVRAIRILTEVADRTRPREVYVPLAVGGHIDHRLAHEAALTAFERREGRNVFLYEDRPESVIPGAIRIRLGQIGARLPPAAGSVEGARLMRYLLRFHLAPSYRGDLRGWAERARSTRLAARSWLETRRWHPQRGLGLRIQPVVHRPEGPDLDCARELRESFVQERGTRAGAAAHRLRGLGSAYAQRLGGDHAERYWLLLPPRDPEGRVAVTASQLYDTVPP